jgi:hypothetical protein
LPNVRIILLITLGLAFAGPNAFAENIWWTLQGVQFNLQGSGARTGTFVYDADTSTYSSVNLMWDQEIAYTTTFPDSPISSDANLVATRTGGNLAGVPGLEVIFSTPLTDAGGTIAVSNSYAFTFCSPDQCGGTSIVAQGTVGSVVSSSAVPEPASILLVGSLALALILQQGRIRIAGGGGPKLARVPSFSTNQVSRRV